MHRVLTTHNCSCHYKLAGTREQDELTLDPFGNCHVHEPHFELQQPQMGARAVLTTPSPPTQASNQTVLVRQELRHRGNVAKKVAYSHAGYGPRRAKAAGRRRQEKTSRAMRM
uniref:Uncharacterized protein n=1 Tax=Eutreptiella gymnastica TaxID=73025 RepID=A0A7S4CSR7_9EUGL